MKEIIGILLTLIVSIMVILLNELLMIDRFLMTIISISIFIIFLIFLFLFYLKQVTGDVKLNKSQIQKITKDLNISNRLIKVEENIEWLKKK